MGLIGLQAEKRAQGESSHEDSENHQSNGELRGLTLIAIGFIMGISYVEVLARL